MSNKWFVSRQCYWGVGPEDCSVVEIAVGGLDYTNPDMLVDRWAKLGEGQEYTDPREALKAAKLIRDAWKTAESDDMVHIEVGATGGYTMPFAEHPTDEQLDQWALAAWNVAPKCDRCGEPLSDEGFFTSAFSDDKFCSDNCADSAYAELTEDIEMED